MENFNCLACGGEPENPMDVTAGFVCAGCFHEWDESFDDDQKETVGIILGACCDFIVNRDFEVFLKTVWNEIGTVLEERHRKLERLN